MFRSKRPKRSLPDAPVVYPSGVCVYTDRGYYLINKDGKRYRISTGAVLESWRFPLVVETSETALSNYPIAVTKLPFRDGSVLQNIADSRMYVVSGGKLRHIVSPSVLERLGGTKPVVVSDGEINMMKKGEDIY